jgi:hypothetical protein
MDREKPLAPGRVRCYLYLYMLDHPNGPAAVCRVPTFLRAYNIQAKYVQMRVGETGLLITYNRRKARIPQPPAYVSIVLPSMPFIDSETGSTRRI